MDIPEKMVGNIGYTLRRQAKQNKIQTRCIGYHCTQTNTNSVNKTWALLHATGVNTNQTNTNSVNKTGALLHATGVNTNQTNTNSVNKIGALLHATGVNTKRFYAEMIMLCFITVCWQSLLIYINNVTTQFNIYC